MAHPTASPRDTLGGVHFALVSLEIVAPSARYPGGEEAGGADVRALLAGGVPLAAAQRPRAGGQRVGRPVREGEDESSAGLCGIRP